MSWMKKYQKKFNMFKVILNREDPTIVEIGAHFGEDSVRFVEAFANPTIHCFEPDPRCIEIFKKHVNNPNIVLYEIALSNVEAELDFYQSYQTHAGKTPDKYDWISDEDYHSKKLNNSGSSSLKKGYKHTLSETIKVKSSRFDTWYNDNNIGEVDLAWIDVQGAERDVLEGMGDKIANVRFVWIEYGEQEYEDAMSREQTVQYMENRGFKVVSVFSDVTSAGDLLFQRK